MLETINPLLQIILFKHNTFFDFIQRKKSY